MDWLWPLYAEYVRRQVDDAGGRREDADLTNQANDTAPPAVAGARTAQQALQQAFLAALSESTATLFVMEPIGDTIRFKGLGRWRLDEVPELLADPNGFIADRFGGGKYKINFHHGYNFVCTHNFRAYGEELWRRTAEVAFE